MRMIQAKTLFDKKSDEIENMRNQLVKKQEAKEWINNLKEELTTKA